MSTTSIRQRSSPRPRTAPSSPTRSRAAARARPRRRRAVPPGDGSRARPGEGARARSPCTPMTDGVVARAVRASPYAIQREVEDLAAVIDVAGGSAHVCGVSSGGAGAGGGEGRRRDGAARGVRGAVHRRWHTSGQRPPPARAGAGDGRGGPTRGGGQDVHADRRRAGTGHRAHAADARVEAAIAVAHTLPHDLSIVIEHEQGKPLPVGYYEESSRRPW